MILVGIRDIGMGGPGEVGVRVLPRPRRRRGGEGVDLAFVSFVHAIKGITGYAN